MKLLSIQRNVMSGQCKGALLRFQIRYTAFFVFPNLIPGWCGSQVGLFTHKKQKEGYSCTGFYFKPWLAKDIAVCQLPRWYRKLTNCVSFSFE